MADASVVSAFPVSNSSLERMFVELAVVYFKDKEKSKEIVLHGTNSSQAGIGTGAGSDRKSPNAQGQGTGSPGKPGNPAIANAYKSIQSRRGKYGGTKLKPGTVKDFRAKGYNVGAPVQTPRRTGENKPK